MLPLRYFLLKMNLISPHTRTINLTQSLPPPYNPTPLTLPPPPPQINLADDAVIERLNSVLEGGRSITLAEKGGGSSEKIAAHPNFQLLATMNPGGDFGKRELSPAIRSRVTEIWASAAPSREDTVLIVQEMLALPLPVSPNQKPDALSGALSLAPFSSKATGKRKGADEQVSLLAPTPTLSPLASAGITPAQLAAIMVDYATWLNEACQARGVAGRVGIREMVAWAAFVSATCTTPQPSTPTPTPASAMTVSVCSALVQGGLMVTLDGLGLGGTTPRSAIHALQVCPSMLDLSMPVKIRIYRNNKS